MVTLLLIEDDHNTARMVAKVLAPHGFEVHHAPNGLTGMRLAREVSPEIILVDMDLPDLEGKVVVSRLRGVHESAHLPIVAFTAECSARAKRLALAFEIAARMCMREGLKKAGARLLEPIMKVEVVTPEDYLGDVIGDLNSRRGQIQGTDTRGNAQAVEAMVPLANMFGYVNQLRSFTQGRAQYTMQFSHYEEVPQNVADEVKAKLA